MELNSKEKQEPEGWARPLPETLPQPTAWPAVLAFGACLLAWGAVTSWMIACAGLVLFLLAAGGWMERMRDESK